MAAPFPQRPHGGSYDMRGRYSCHFSGVRTPRVIEQTRWMALSTSRSHSRTVSAPVDTPSMWLWGLNDRKLPTLALGLIDWPMASALDGTEMSQSRTALSLPPLASV